MKKFKILFLASVFTIAFSAGIFFASATKPVETGHKVTICHRTNSDMNPYVVITVDIAVAGYGGGKGDHYAKHQGPVWELGLKEQHIKWGDIIPPYTYEGDDDDENEENEFEFDGYNWNEAGIVIYENGCRVDTPSPTETPSPSVSPSISPSTTPTHSTSVDPTRSPTPPSVSGVPHTAKTGIPDAAIPAGIAGITLLVVGTFLMRRFAK